MLLVPSIQNGEAWEICHICFFFVQVTDDASPLLDADGNLCVLVSVLCANLVNKKGSEGNNILDVTLDDARSFSIATTAKDWLRV